MLHTGVCGAVLFAASAAEALPHGLEERRLHLTTLPDELARCEPCSRSLHIAQTAMLYH